MRINVFDLNIVKAIIQSKYFILSLEELLQ